MANRKAKKYGQLLGSKLNREARDLLNQASWKFGRSRAGEAFYTFNNWLRS